MPGAAPEVIGRDDELAALEAFLDADSELPGALLFEGETGMGKTTLWEHGVAAARERGFRVLSCRTSPSEATFSFAGLADLLEGVLEEALAPLPAPQAHGLRTALLLEDPGGVPSDPRAVAAGCLNGLRSLAASSPLLVAIDDVQWLDRSSEGALAFAARRLHDEPIAFFLSLRVGKGEPGAPPLVQALPARRLTRVRVGPLSLGAIHHLLRRHLDLRLSRPRLRRLEEISHGNPFFALELAQALARAGDRDGAGDDLPVPATLRDLIRERLDALPPETYAGLLPVAALARPTLPLLTAALGEDAAARLEHAFDAHVVELHGAQARFSHPLLASVVYAEAGPADRLAVHRRLAELVPEREERARHLAVGLTEPDADAVREIDAAVRDADARGATAAAVELLELAIRLTPADDAESLWRRRIELGHHYFLTGDVARARETLVPLVDELPPGPPRARALTEPRLGHGVVADRAGALRACAGRGSERSGDRGRRELLPLVRVAPPGQPPGGVRVRTEGGCRGGGRPRRRAPRTVPLG